jgi:hypothetical protein
MIPFVLTLVIVFLITHSVISLFETTVDTIFICSCSQCCEVDEADVRSGVKFQSMPIQMSDITDVSPRVQPDVMENQSVRKGTKRQLSERMTSVRVDFHEIFSFT